MVLAFSVQLRIEILVYVIPEAIHLSDFSVEPTSSKLTTDPKNEVKKRSLGTKSGRALVLTI